MILVVMEETWIIEFVNISLMKLSEDNGKIMWKNRIMDVYFKEIVIDLRYNWTRLSLEKFENLND